MGRAHEVRAKSMAATAAAKSALYNRMSRDIYLAAKGGSTDPNANIALRSAIDKAKKSQVPSHVIENAIKKAAGGTGEALFSNVYEGYGPGNVAVIVECTTDNDNRTFTEVRTAFNKTGGNIGTSVGYLFSRKAEFVFDGMSEDEAMEALMMGDADFEELKTDEDGFTVILADPKDFEAIKAALEAANPEMEYEECGVNLIPANYVDLDEDHEAKFRRFLDLLSELDDVQEVHHNANIELDEE